MAQTDNSRKRTIQGHKIIKLQAPIRCIQINLQHSRAATDNILKLIEQGKSDIVLIQEPYLYQNSIAGIIKSQRYCISHEDKCRTAIIITNNKMDAVLIKQLSKPDSVLISRDITTLDSLQQASISI
jgi:endonuclease/exonuclease/phosphatase (EEP) superfamily protein YafD